VIGVEVAHARTLPQATATRLRHLAGTLRQAPAATGGRATGQVRGFALP
jgi:hypothetical protein